jgi:hypothetical protein
VLQQDDGNTTAHAVWAIAEYRPFMTPTPLIQRVSRMKNEISRGEESFERKLRYLLWLN